VEDAGGAYQRYQQGRRQRYHQAVQQHLQSLKEPAALAELGISNLPVPM